MDFYFRRQNLRPGVFYDGKAIHSQTIASMIPLKNPLFTKIRDDENDQPYSESRMWGICERKILASFLAEDFFSRIRIQSQTPVTRLEM